MVQYKLNYFDLRGRGEAIRILFKIAKVPFEDNRIAAEQWPAYKDETPFGQIPVLEVDGQKLTHSTAILRYLGGQFGLTGKTPIENALIDALADHLQDFQNEPDYKQWVYTVIGRVEGDAPALFKEKVRPLLAQYAGLYEKFLVEHGRQSLALGDNLTWLDVFAAETFTKFAEYGESDILEAFPHIEALIQRVNSIPEVRAYLSERPKVAF
uniref:glutathione transferase n=1 Tax=Panagrellus redivivus TaxID=6233 RepID=A0A7E4VCC6_PANRE